VTDTAITGEGRTVDLLKVSGLLDPNVTLDTLMDVSRQLAEAGVIQTAVGTYFVGAYYVYKYITR
jgi:hypothetical protein